MENEFENLWICPICSAEHSVPVIGCYRCGAQLLLLNKVKLTAYKLREGGYIELSERLYNKEFD